MSQNNLYTFGKEYVLPDGREYIGSYHMHPDKGAMVGAEHSSAPHDYLTPINDGKKVITSFDFDYSDLPAVSEKRSFSIVGLDGAEFKLEIKDSTTGKYYNFVTNTFQTSVDSLQKTISNGRYGGAITFPAVTGSDDQYDIYLHAMPGTVHAPYNEVRFGDGSVDLNSSTGSSSLVMQKVLYQNAAITLTLQGYSPNGTVDLTAGTATLDTNRYKSTKKTAFSFTTTSSVTTAYRIVKQPVADDFIAFVSPTIGSAPVTLPGENEYPTRRDAFTGDDINGAITSGSVVRMDNTDLSAVIAVGDKVTAATSTDTVNGDFSGGATAITMDSAVATKMAVGDQVTGNAVLDKGIFLVDSIDSTNVFSLDSSAAIEDGTTLTFSSKVNRSLTTVTVVETSGTATDFTMSQAIQFRDNQPLTFTPQKNYQWPVNNYVNLIKAGMIVVPGTNVTASTVISRYTDTSTIFTGTEQEKTITKNTAPASSTVGLKPTITKGLVTTQAGNIVFNNQQVLALAGDTLKIGGYGETEILRVSGWNIKLTDLKVELTAPTTTTSGTVSASATIGVADREGVINNVSRIGGIGINPALQNPLVTAGGGADGAGNWTADASQTLESGITLTVENTGRIATVTGNVEIIRAGTADTTVRLDIEKILSNSAP